MAVNEIRRGDFVYRDTLFADTGSNKRHTRASVAELKDLLLPKRGRIPLQDPVGHWYEAQLVHYGLPRTKDKNAAKVRLTTALAAGTLAVPAYILQMETDMKKEYVVADRKEKAAAKRLGTQSNGGVAGGRKRKADSTDDKLVANSSTKVSVKIGDATINIDHRENVAGSSKKRKAFSPSSRTRSSVSTPTVRRHTARPSRTPSSPVATPSPIPSRNRQYKYSNNRHQYQEDSDPNDSPPPAYESLNFASRISHNEHRSHTDYLQASGHYSLNNDNDEDDRQFSLIKDKSTDEFWGHFRAAGHEGVLHITDPNGMTEQQRVPFTWRAEDIATGRLRFRRDQDGWIWFDGRGGIRGCWNRLLYDEDVEFEGELDGESDFGVRELVERCDGFVRAAYGRC